VAESAFTTSQLPVILSLEMHCSPRQQHRLAEMMVSHFGDALLSVRAEPKSRLERSSRHTRFLLS
jgi:hypothetical protein